MRSLRGGIDRPALRELASSPVFAARVHDLLRRVADVSEVSDALDLLGRTGRRLGASSCCFVSFVRDDGSCAAYRMLLACDPRWGTEYLTNNWFETDPWLSYALHAEEPVLASALSPETEPERAMVRSAAEYGFRSVLIAPAPSAAGASRVGVLYVGSDVDGYYEGDGYRQIRPLAQALAMALHACWMRTLRRELLGRTRITQDDLVLLRHEANGHGSKVIAAELGTEAKTIDCRFQRLNAKLGAPSRRAAVRIARLYGLL